MGRQSPSLQSRRNPYSARHPEVYGGHVAVASTSAADRRDDFLLDIRSTLHLKSGRLADVLLPQPIHVWILGVVRNHGSSATARTASSSHSGTRFPRRTTECCAPTPPGSGRSGGRAVEPRRLRWRGSFPFPAAQAVCPTPCRDDFPIEKSESSITGVTVLVSVEVCIVRVYQVVESSHRLRRPPREEDRDIGACRVQRHEPP